MKLFKKVPTVAAALAGFEKVRAELRAVKEHHDAEAAKHESLVTKVQEEAAEVIRRTEEAAAAAVAKAEALKGAAEREARDAVQALARFEAILGL